MNKTRLEAFSDGVFAIIITIMVLELKMPHDAQWSSLQPLLPVLLSYILSFIYVGIYWGNHHHIVHTVKKVSPAIIWSNMFLLFCLSLIPFVTGWMGENHFATNPIIAYAVILMLCGTAFTVLQIAIKKSNPFTPALKTAFDKVKQKGYISVASYLVAIAMAFVNPVISGIIIVGVAIIWLVPDRRIEIALNEQE